jgi:hypothetical protein
MPIKVKGPDGIVTQFPDGTDDATINRVMAATYRPAAAPKDTSAARGVALGAVKPLDNLVRAASNIPGFDAVDRLGQRMGLPSANAAVTANDAARANNTRTGFQTVGNIAGTAPTLALPGGALAQGAAGGALLTDARDGVGVARDAVIGAVGNKVADVGLTTVSKAIAPKVNQYIAQLTAAGVPVTPGQLARSTKTRAGNIIAGIEDKFTSLPVVGGMINNDRIQGVEQLNRAFVDRVLKPIGQKLPAAVETGHAAVAFAQQAVKDAYQAVIPKSSGKVDGRFLQRIQVAQARAMLPPKHAAALADDVKNYVGNLADMVGNFSGKRVGQVTDKLDKVVATYSKSTDPYEREMGEVLGKVRKEIFDLVGRNNPAAKTELKAANEAYANLVRLENAVANTAEGIATPARFRQAIVRSDRSIRKRASAGNNALGQDLAKAGEAVLPSRLPDSGTATRASSANMLALGLGAAAAPVYAASRAAVPLVTRTPGATSQYVSRLVEGARLPARAAVPALLARPGNE